MTSRAGYWIGGALVLAACAGAVLWAVYGFVRLDATVDDFVRVAVPGAQTVQLEARTYTVYFEGPGADADSIPPIVAVIRDPRTEELLPIARYGGSLNYGFGGHNGVAYGTIKAPRAGGYLVAGDAGVDRSAGLAIALGDSIAKRLVLAIVGAFAIAGVLGLAGVGLIVATAIRRNTGRRGA